MKTTRTVWHIEKEHGYSIVCACPEGSLYNITGEDFDEEKGRGVKNEKPSLSLAICLHVCI